jgi:hypothetical protein
LEFSDCARAWWMAPWITWPETLMPQSVFGFQTMLPFRSIFTRLDAVAIVAA